jgi:hypothetical protein
MSRQQQEQHQQQGTDSISKRPDPEGETSSPKRGQPHPQYGDVTFKDQVKEEILPISLATAAAAEAAAPPRGRTAADDIPMVSAVAVSESQMFAEAEEDRLHYVERRVAAAAADAVRGQVAQLERKLAAVRAPPQEPHRRSGNRHDVADIDGFAEDDRYVNDRLQDAERRAATAEAARRDQEVRLTDLEREMAAVRLPPPALPLTAPQQIWRINNRHDDVDAIENFDDENDDDDIENWTQQQLQRQVVRSVNANTKVVDTSNESNNNSGDASPKQLSRRQRRCIVVTAMAVLFAAAAVAGICGTGRCSSTSTVSTRAGSILSYINGITLSGRTLTYPSRSSAEERAVQWLVVDDLGTAVDDELSLRQRYVLGTFWFLQSSTTHFGTDSKATTWTTNLDECQWSNVFCDGDGRVTAVNLRQQNVQGQIPDDLGLLTDITTLILQSNRLTGTIPSSLGLMTALTDLGLGENELNGTIPLSIGDWTALERLQLWENKLSGTIPASFQSLTALKDLGLSKNVLTGTIPSTLGALTAMTSLQLFKNQLNGKIPLSLGALTAMRDFDLSGNQLSGTIPTTLFALTALKTLWLSDNGLVGTMPFCGSEHRFTSLVADCLEVRCDCCTHCCPAAFGHIPVASSNCV